MLVCGLNCDKIDSIDEASSYKSENIYIYMKYKGGDHHTKSPAGLLTQHSPPI